MSVHLIHKHLTAQQKAEFLPKLAIMPVKTLETNIVIRDSTKLRWQSFLSLGDHYHTTLDLGCSKIWSPQPMEIQAKMYPDCPYRRKPNDSEMCYAHNEMQTSGYAPFIWKCALHQQSNQGLIAWTKAAAMVKIEKNYQSCVTVDSFWIKNLLSAVQLPYLSNRNSSVSWMLEVSYLSELFNL